MRMFFLDHGSCEKKDLIPGIHQCHTMAFFLEGFSVGMSIDPKMKWIDFKTRPKNGGPNSEFLN